MRILKRMVKLFFARKLLRCGQNFRFNPFNCYLEYEHIEIGNNVFINRNAYIAGKIAIEDNVMIGPNVTIINGSGNHIFRIVGQHINQQGREQDVKPIMIAKDSWIAANVVIIKGAGVGEGSVIGAGSIVTKEMPPYCVCLGNPCKPVKYRYTDEELRQHLILLNRSSEEAENTIQKRRQMFQSFSL
jgi:acetyltransferase-like isoleucine patch superfamily enzyme